ncbi:MAG: hypothetical protein ACREXQ_00900 [Polaromonas sp.]
MQRIPAPASLSVRAMISEGIADGSISSRVDPKVAAFAIFGAMHWMPSWFVQGGELSARAIADRFFSLFDMGLTASRT